MWLEPREVVQVQLDRLLRGGTGLLAQQQWFAHAPHLPAPVAVDAGSVVLLGALSPREWAPARALRATHGAACVRSLLKAGLLIGSTRPWRDQREADERHAALHWHPLAAAWHAQSRWQGVDSAREASEAGIDTAQGLRQRHGLPPLHVHERAQARQRQRLAPAAADPFDALLDARLTCRNFDRDAQVTRAQLSQLLARVFGARADVAATADFHLLKRTSPSGGGLHPVDCHLLVQRVRRLAPGLYHYHPVAHALEPLLPGVAPPAAGDAGTHAPAAGDGPWTAAAWRALARIAVAGQDWFADAPVLCVLAPRYARNYWKYRNHPKAYRVVILDAGHLSQTLQLCATQMGLGAFVTAAINEIDIEHAFGLEAMQDGPLAVCGFGPRAQAMRQFEFDPLQRTWPRPG